jgi:hypothetical protein
MATSGIPEIKGLKKPTAIEPAGNVLWIGDRLGDNATSIPLPD